MYKRVEKREKKKEKEEKLGLDSEMKEVLGMHDTDSDESDSDSSDSSESSDSDSDEEAAEPTPAPTAAKGVKRKRSQADEGEQDEKDNSSDDDSDGSDDSGEEEAVDPAKDMSLQDALANPVYVVSEPELKACLLCPGRELKNEKMLEVHLKSGGHQRRMKRFRAISENAEPSTNAREFLKANVNKPTKPEAMSHRAKRREERLARINVKREAKAVKKAKQKEKLAAKEAERAEKGLPPSKPTGGRKAKKQKKEVVRDEAKPAKRKFKTSGPPNKKSSARYFAGGDSRQNLSTSGRDAGWDSSKAGKFGRAGQEKRKEQHALKDKADDGGLKIFN